MKYGNTLGHATRADEGLIRAMLANVRDSGFGDCPLTLKLNQPVPAEWPGGYRLMSSWEVETPESAA